MKPTPQSQSLSHHFIWRHLNQTLPPQIPLELQMLIHQFNEAAAEHSQQSVDVRLEETTLPILGTGITAHISTQTPLGMDMEDTDMPQTPQLEFKTNVPKQTSMPESAVNGPSADDELCVAEFIERRGGKCLCDGCKVWHDFLDEIEKQHNKEK